MSPTRTFKPGREWRRKRNVVENFRVEKSGMMGGWRCSEKGEKKKVFFVDQRSDSDRTVRSLRDNRGIEKTSGGERMFCQEGEDEEMHLFGWSKNRLELQFFN